MTYAQALAALEKRQETRIELGLDRFTAHLARLGRPHARLRAVHVAGTNGKGSVCAMLEAGLRAAGYRTGLYISPHLRHVRERIQVGGRAIAPRAFAALLERALRADPCEELTYFELLTSVAFQHFEREKVEAAVLETGLGGRLDATNVVDPLASVITSIDFDHMNFLGRTIPEIAGEKAGIIKAGRPVYCPALRPDALASISSRARAVGAPLRVVRSPWRAARAQWASNRQILSDGNGGRWTVSLLGGRQPGNAALARAALGGLAPALKVSDSAWRAGLRTVRWPGRFEVRRLGRRLLVLDGAHNVQAMRALRETLDASPWGRGRILFMIGMLRDKDVAGTLAALKGLLREATLVRAPSPRALEAAALAALARPIFPRAALTVEPDVRAAIGNWRRAPGGAPVAVVCGSFYLVGAAMGALS